jgi:carboxyvinyl-carboxyphosphonate phosphorylmutase
MTVLGAPDLVVMSLSEFAAQAYRICRAGNLALLVDADHGYGNALNVKRTVEELETAGVVAMTIEDTDLPQPFGTVGTSRLIPLEEGVGKMQAALAGRQDPNLVIVGRTSAKLAGGIAEAVARAKAYEAAGVDALFLAGIENKAQVEAMAEAVHIPIVMGGFVAGMEDRDYLYSLGVRVCLHGHQPFFAAVRAIYDALEAARAGTPPGDIKQVASDDLMKHLIRDGDYRGWMETFLGG